MASIARIFKPGMGCVVMGAGPIGLAALSGASQRRQPIIVSELAMGRAELALKLGATGVVNPKQKARR